jgi:hypothetical protein
MACLSLSDFAGVTANSLEKVRGAPEARKLGWGEFGFSFRAASWPWRA